MWYFAYDIRLSTTTGDTPNEQDLPRPQLHLH